MTQEIKLPEPAFRLRWKENRGEYTVSKPNIGDTDCYTEDQLIATIEADRQARGGAQTKPKPAETRANTGLGGGAQRSAFLAWLDNPACPLDANEFNGGDFDIGYESWKAALQSQEAQALKKDAERLNFITAPDSIWSVQRCKSYGQSEYKFRMVRDGEPWGEWHPSAREAIDIARGQKT